jgi:hypothetical protein
MRQARNKIVASIDSLGQAVLKAPANALFHLP